MRPDIARAVVDAYGSPRNLTHYDPEDEPTSCLSTEPHDNTVEDAVQHYFGCIEICERAKFLKPSHRHWKHEWKIQHGICYAELEKTKKFLNDNDKWENHLKTAQEKLKEAGHPVPDGDRPTIDSISKARANEWLEKRMGTVAIAIDAQYKRIEILRTALSKTPTRHQRHLSNQQPAVKTEGCIVTQLEESRANWKKSPRFNRGIEWVRQWKKRQSNDNDDDGSSEPERQQVKDLAKKRQSNDNDDDGSSEPERQQVKDLAKKQRKKKNTQSENGRQSNQDPSNELAEDNDTEYHLERDVNAYLIQFSTEYDTGRPSQDAESFLTPIDEPLTDGRFRGTFPDQRISMSFLLDNGVTPGPESTDNSRLRTHDPEGDWNILSRNRCKSQDDSGPPKRIRYFHIPSNNMAWVEKAIANYYETETPGLNRKLRHQSVQTPTHMLLSPQYWRGQQQGTRSGVVHARHMRSLCEVVSTETNEIEKHPKNVVLFMPYLHWETDRKRETISRLIDVESDKFRRNRKEEKKKKKEDRQQERLELTKLSEIDIDKRKIRHAREGAEDPESQNNLLETFDLALHQLFRRRREARRDKRPYIDDSGRLIVMSALGQYLVDAARLYDAMSTYRDQRMLEKYLFHDPPLHPRRTLDQSYYWTLRTTKARDRDQVIYRDTKLDFIHKLQEAEKPKHSLWIKSHSSPQQPLNRTTNSATPVTVEEPAHGPGDHGIAQYVEDDVSPLMKWTHHSETTDKHGCDQCKSDIKKVSQLIMVDQLWMWVLDEHTIITSFPRRYGSNKHDLSGVHRSIRARLKSFRKNQVRSVYDLALIILDECSNTFFDRARADEGQPQVMDIFSEAIGRVTNQHTISFQHVWHWTQEASKIYRARSKYVSSAHLHVSLLDINPEGKLQREVKDILDELDIMLHVHKRQRDIMKRFCRHVEHILDPTNRWSGDCYVEDDTSEPSLKPSGNASVRSGNNSKSDEQTGTNDKETRRREQLGWFRFQYQELLSEVNDRIDELEGLRAGAKSTADSVNDLLALKQQQASVVQAWESVRQAEEAVTQGRAVMMFTIVTIVFLPLSFMSSIFGMNNWEFTDSGPMHLGEQFKLMFSISIGIIIATIVVAFSPLFRATVVSFTKYVFTVLVVYSQLYRFWIVFQDEYRSQSLMYKTELKVRKMKEEVRKAKRKRAARRAELLNNPETPKRSWPSKLFGAGNSSVAEGKLMRRSELVPNGKPESGEAVEHGEQSDTRPPSTVSNLTTQVNTNTMFGGNTPTLPGTRTPEPGLARIGSDPGKMV